MLKIAVWLTGEKFSISGGGELRRKARHVLFVLIGLSFLLLAESTTAKSFPFRGVKEGEKLPAVSLVDAASGQAVKAAAADGRGVLLVFVGADLASKKKRSLKALKVVAGLNDFLAKKKIDVYVIDSQGGDQDAVREIIAKAKVGGRLYVDPGREVYGRLGIFVMPSLLLVAPDGAIAAGMGYSHDLGKRLRGAVEVMLGEKTQEEIEAELHPRMVEMSKEEAAARRHFHLGQTLAAKGQPEMAVKELKKAIAIDEKMGKAHIELGCLYLDLGDAAAAKKSLAVGLGLEPDDLAGQICRARIKAASGAVDEAVDDLRVLMFRHLRSPDLHYWLGSFYAMNKDDAAAASEFRKAYELLKRRGVSGGAGR